MRCTTFSYMLMSLADLFQCLVSDMQSPETKLKYKQFHRRSSDGPKWNKVLFQFYFSFAVISFTLCQYVF